MHEHAPHLTIASLPLALNPALAATEPAVATDPAAADSGPYALPSGERLQATRSGAGQPVVLVPGLFGSAQEVIS